MLDSRTSRRALAATCVCLGIAFGAGLASAQEVRMLNLSNVPPDMIQDGAAPAPGVTTGTPTTTPPSAPALDLGQRPATAYQAAAFDSAPSRDATTPARRAAQSVQSGARVGNVRRVNPVGSTGTERAVFSREPVRVTLAVGRERLITLPAPAALHVPTDIESVMRLEVIDRTIYARALVPFASLRVVAELVDSGQQIPLDLEAGASSAGAGSELEVSVVEPGGAGVGAGTGVGAASPQTSADSGTDTASADMVQLTRHAARMLYAPRRLAWGTANVHQVALENKPVAGLMRGVDVETTALGQWKSGALYVTALRVTNRSRLPVELPIDNLRGRWLAATAQHGRLGPAGSEIDTTAIYLICDRAFEACL